MLPTAANGEGGDREHHATEPEIWLVYYRKESGKPRILYNDAVEEAL